MAIAREQEQVALPAGGARSGPFGLPAGWWPVAARHEIGRHPGKFVLGTRALAVYRDRTGIVRAVDDVCPHRRMPLSMGRITKDGYLQCAYHGWCFDGATGLCARIPNFEPTERVKSNVRVAAFTTAEGLADAAGFQLRTGIAPAVGPGTGEEPDEGTTMWETRLADGFVTVWTGDGAATREPPSDTAAGRRSRLLRRRFDVRAPHALVAQALLWNPGRVLSLGAILGSGPQLTGPEVGVTGRVVRAKRTRVTFDLPRPHTFDTWTHGTTSTEIAIDAVTGLASLRTELGHSEVTVRVALTPVSDYVTTVRWDVVATPLSGELVCRAPAMLRLARRAAAAESVADTVTAEQDPALEAFRTIRQEQA